MPRDINKTQSNHENLNSLEETVNRHQQWNDVLELPDKNLIIYFLLVPNKNFEAAVIKILKWAITESLKKILELKSSAKKFKKNN